MNLEDVRAEIEEEKRKKRNRVRKMKRFIVGVIVVWFILSVLSWIFFGFEIYSLHKELLILKEAKLQKEVLAGQKGDQGLQEDSEELLENSVIPDSEREDKDNIAREGDERVAYLTFDDGPSELTDDVLDILKQYDVKATFFVNGHTDEHSIEMYQRIVQEGHTIGMHSYTHDYKEIYASLNAFSSDFDRIMNLIYDSTGVASVFYRFPGGSSNTVSKQDMSLFIRFLDEQGITYFDWNVASGDATNAPYTTSTVVENIMRDVVKYKTSVVLMHDSGNKQRTVEALPIVIRRLQKEGIKMAAIDEDTRVIQHLKR